MNKENIGMNKIKIIRKGIFYNKKIQNNKQNEKA